MDEVRERLDLLYYHPAYSEEQWQRTEQFFTVMDDYRNGAPLERLPGELWNWLRGRSLPRPLYWLTIMPKEDPPPKTKWLCILKKKDAIRFIACPLEFRTQADLLDLLNELVHPHPNELMGETAAFLEHFGIRITDETLIPALLWTMERALHYAEGKKYPWVDKVWDRVVGTRTIIEYIGGLSSVTAVRHRLETLYGYDLTHATAQDLLRLTETFYDAMVLYLLGLPADAIAAGTRRKFTWGAVIDHGEIPRLVTLAATVPAEPPPPGMAYLHTRRPSRFGDSCTLITVPLEIRTVPDLLHLVNQLARLEPLKNYSGLCQQFKESYEIDIAQIPVMEQLAYLLGLVLADGTFNDSLYAGNIVVKASTVYDWADRLLAFVKVSLARFGITAYYHTEKADPDAQSKRFSEYDMQLVSSGHNPLLLYARHVLLRLQDEGTKTYIPLDCDYIFQMPKAFRVRFLQGLADGDGTVDIAKHRLAISSLVNRKFIIRLLQSLGIHARLQFVRDKEARVETLQVAVSKTEDLLRAAELPAFFLTSKLDDLLLAREMYHRAQEKGSRKHYSQEELGILWQIVDDGRDLSLSELVKDAWEKYYQFKDSCRSAAALGQKLREIRKHQEQGGDEYTSNKRIFSDKPMR